MVQFRALAQQHCTLSTHLK